MSCNNHCYESNIKELEEQLYDRDCEIETLEVETRMMRARMERLEVENVQLQKQVDALIIVAEAKDRERLKVIDEIWRNTRGEV